tara:strand:- start:2486 stop:3124 length:639 start_codon:yes stop_codon:yes gene_type:complete
MGTYEKNCIVKIFFDLDGTLIDSKTRLYKLFQYLVPLSNFSYHDYWKLKKGGIGHQKILIDYFQFTTEQIHLFNEKWMDLIEKKHWLDFDKPFDGVTEKLSNLQQNGHQLYIVTARQKKEPVLNQVNTFKWNHFFEEVLVTEQKKEKVELIRPFIDTTNCIVVGDTGKDIETGKKLNARTVAVLSGFLNEKTLKKYNPDVIIDNLTSFNTEF